MIQCVDALVIAHDHLSSPALLTAGLEAAGFELTVHLVVTPDRFASPDVRSSFPELAGFDLIVALGAPWSVYDIARIGTWVTTEQQYLSAADRAGVPVLGVCFGGQLLAQAHGGTVTRSDDPEIGWTQVLTDAPELVESGPWFQWHFDRWELPDGARELARNERASQAFTLRRNLAVQFHPELDEKTLIGWLDNGGVDSARANGVDPDELVAATVANEPAAAERADRLVRRFLDQIAFADA